MVERRLNVRGIIWHDEKLLAVRHKRKDGSAAAYYAVPGGGLDPLEPMDKGIARELFEETGVHAKVGRVLFVQQFRSERDGYDEEIEFFFLIENSEDFISIDLTNTSHGDKELAVCEFVNPTNVTILPKFLQSIEIAKYIATPQLPYLYIEL